MTYDPKKSRPDNQSKSIIDQIIEEPMLDNQTSNPYEPETTEQSAVAESKPENVIELPGRSNTSSDEDEEIDEETPLVMQPQVWVAAGIAAFLLLVLVKRRKKR